MEARHVPDPVLKASHGLFYLIFMVICGSRYQLMFNIWGNWGSEVKWLPRVTWLWICGLVSHAVSPYSTDFAGSSAQGWATFRLHSGDLFLHPEYFLTRNLTLVQQHWAETCRVQSLPESSGLAWIYLPTGPDTQLPAFSKLWSREMRDVWTTYSITWEFSQWGM